MGRARASSTSLRATRGTSTRSAPTAERSHCLQHGKQHDDGHDIACDARFSGTEDATAPRSDRGGRRYRGSREGSLRSPARDPRLFPSTAPRSFSRPNSSAPSGLDRTLGGYPRLAPWAQVLSRLLRSKSLGNRRVGGLAAVNLTLLRILATLAAAGVNGYSRTRVRTIHAQASNCGDRREVCSHPARPGPDRAPLQHCAYAAGSRHFRCT